MKKSRITLLMAFSLVTFAIFTQASDQTIKITKKYLNLPVSHQVERSVMTIKSNGETIRRFDIRLAPEKPDYWVFCDMSKFKNKKITISYQGNQQGLQSVFQADSFVGSDSLYQEQNRPQFHFTSRRGWNNDPNGLVYYNGEYHLFYQHNPYEKNWGNMHWGHAVSTDLLHWKELNDALYPDQHGTMFSGSAVIDYKNTSGFGKPNRPAMVAIYTASSPAKQVQCIAYSLDKGRTWTKYANNPVIDSKAIWKSQHTRDPKVFWYAPGQHWVMVLFERDGHSIYNSSNLKDWTYQSHITGFWECPELFELPVDGNTHNKKWVMYGASGTYMIGTFDGKRFQPEAGKYYFNTGQIYASQTYTNIPKADGRRIQVGWGQIQHPGMPFSSMMTIPTELTLQTTKDGIRLFSYPIRELNRLQTLRIQKNNLTSQQATQVLQAFNNENSLRIRITLKLSHATGAGITLSGQNIFQYDMNHTRVNDIFYSPEDFTSMEITADILIDKTSVEVFVDNGAFAHILQREAIKGKPTGFSVFGNNIQVKNLEVYTIRSIWEK